MSDDIFIKHPLGPFQQPYIARTPLVNQQPVIAQQPRQQPAIAQSPSTYQLRTPGEYQHPIATQNPSIRNAQTPFIRDQQEPNIRNQQEPNIRNNQTPFTYQHRSPSTYQHRNPFTYQVTYQHRATVSYQHRSPSTYRDPRSYRNPFTYQHRTPSTTQATGRTPLIYNHRSPGQYQHRSPSTYQGQEPNIRDRQNPFIRNAQTPVIRTYQTPYSHQQPATGFLTVGRTESIATLTELITGFGTGGGIPDAGRASPAGISLTANGDKQGAGSLLVSDFEMDISTNGGLAGAMSGGGFTFNVGYSNNDVVISVKEGGQTFGTPRVSRIGNMSSSTNTSFSYTTSNVSSSSFTEIARLTNIGSGRGQVKLNFPNPTASPYNLDLSGASTGWLRDDEYYTGTGNSSDGDQVVDFCTPLQWPRTTIASPFFSQTSGGSGSATFSNKFFYQAENEGQTNENTNTITTSYQNIPTTVGSAAGFEIGMIVGSVANDSTGSSDNTDGASTIVEIIVKDLDGGTEYKFDLLIIFALATIAESNDDDENLGE